MSDVLSHPRFQDEQAAYDWVEAHLWPDGPVCPRCGGLDRITKLQGKSTRIGTYKCKDCRKPFTVKVGTIFEDSHIPMRMWLQAIALLCASKEGISSNQLHRMLGITLKSAWFMSHRLREAMRSGPLALDFPYNARVALGVDDQQRAAPALVGASGKRLTYRTARGASTAAGEVEEAPPS